jgi:hypothetical protein
MIKLAFLPNVRGFEFIGIDQGLKRHECYVAVEASNLHVVRRKCDDALFFKQLVGWDRVRK